MSSFASNGIQVLSDQIQRSVYLLKLLSDIEALSETDKDVPQWLMMEVFVIREEIEETESTEELFAI